MQTQEEQEQEQVEKGAKESGQQFAADVDQRPVERGTQAGSECYGRRKETAADEAGEHANGGAHERLEQPG